MVGQVLRSRSGPVGKRQRQGLEKVELYDPPPPFLGILAKTATLCKLPSSPAARETAGSTRCSSAATSLRASLHPWSFQVELQVSRSRWQGPVGKESAAFPWGFSSRPGTPSHRGSRVHERTSAPPSVPPKGEAAASAAAARCG